MKSDFQVLGIEPTDDPRKIKAAYRKLAKQIHPDIHDSSFENHLKFIALQQAYHRLMKDKPVGKPPPKIVKSAANPAIIPVKDQAYSFYKAGMKEYMKIHPSFWNESTKVIIIANGQKDIEKLKATENKVRDLTKSFPRAYYYFSIVVNEFPDSIWSKDAADKINSIEHQTIRYKSIIESFLQHSKIAPRVNKMF